MSLFSSLKRKLSKTLGGKLLNKSHLVKTVNKTMGGKMINGALGLNDDKSAALDPATTNRSPGGFAGGFGYGMRRLSPDQEFDFSALAGAEPMPGGAPPADAQVPEEPIAPPPPTALPVQQKGMSAADRAQLQAVQNARLAKRGMGVGVPGTGLDMEAVRASMMDEYAKAKAAAPADGGPPSGPIMATGLYNPPKVDPVNGPPMGAAARAKLYRAATIKVAPKKKKITNAAPSAY